MRVSARCVARTSGMVVDGARVLARRKRCWSCGMLRRRVLIAVAESRKMSARLCGRGRSPVGRYSGRGEVQLDVVQEVRPPAAYAHMWGKLGKRLLKAKYLCIKRAHTYERQHVHQAYSRQQAHVKRQSGVSRDHLQHCIYAMKMRWLCKGWLHEAVKERDCTCLPSMTFVSI